MKVLRAIIIDDEEAAIEMLKLLAARNPDLVRVVAGTLKPEEGIALIEDYRPDVVFLDISMPTMNGFELLDKLSYKNFKLVFTTAHKDYAIQAIRNKAFDYLLKPIDTDDFRRCLEEMQNETVGDTEILKTTASTLIELLVKDGIHYIKQQEIIRLEASRSYTVFYLDNAVKHVASKSIKEFEEKLDAEIFYRCHKSHIINLYKVQKFVNHDGFYALMTDGSLPDISKSCKDSFLTRLKQIKI